jgi:hypothetical protein
MRKRSSNPRTLYSTRRLLRSRRTRLLSARTPLGRRPAVRPNHRFDTSSVHDSMGRDCTLLVILCQRSNQGAVLSTVHQGGQVAGDDAGCCQECSAQSNSTQEVRSCRHPRADLTSALATQRRPSVANSLQNPSAARAGGGVYSSPPSRSKSFAPGAAGLALLAP